MSERPPRIRHLIVDRDGVLNRELDTGWITDPARWVWEEGSLDALRAFSDAGLRISIATNQSGIGRGVVDAEAVDRLHGWLRSEIAAAGAGVAGIFVCPHAPGDGCSCRKPLPGLILEAVRSSGIPAAESIVIGDDVRDLEAGRAAGVPVALVLTGKGEASRARIDGELRVFNNLLHAARELAGGASLTGRSREGLDARL